MTVADVISARGIECVLHFTTNVALSGILGESYVLSRQRLPEAKYVEHVYAPNAQVRRDGAYLDYVNLSISRLNWEFFEASQRWHAHRDVWWCALVFEPKVLEADEVLFATTNNIYTGCRRGPGGVGLEAMFSDRVVRWHGNVVDRPDRMPRSWTTCHQAEALVPTSVPTSSLTGLLVATDVHSDIAFSQCEILLGDLPIIVDASAFEPDTRG